MNLHGCVCTVVNELQDDFWAQKLEYSSSAETT